MINFLVMLFVLYVMIDFLRSVLKDSKLNVEQQTIAEKLKKDGWTNISFEQGSRLAVARKPGKSWCLLSEDGKEICFTNATDKPEFHDGIWYCKTWRGYDYYDAQGYSVDAYEIREITKRLPYDEESQPDQRCCDCIHCEDTTHWLDVLTFQDSDYRFSCKEGLVDSLMNDYEATYGNTAQRCAKYKHR